MEVPGDSLPILTDLSGCLSDEQLRLPPPLCTEIVKQRRIADELAGLIPHGRESECDLDQRAVTAAAPGVIRHGPYPGAEPRERVLECVPDVGGDQNFNLRAQNVRRPVAEQSLRPRVPAVDEMVESRREDGVVRRLNDRGQARLGRPRLVQLSVERDQTTVGLVQLMAEMGDLSSPRFEVRPSARSHSRGSRSRASVAPRRAGHPGPPLTSFTQSTVASSVARRWSR